MRWILISLLAFSGAGAARAGTPPLEEILPASTDMLVVIEDVPNFLEKWRTGPWGRLWNDPALAPFTHAMKESLEIATWDEEVREATGQTLTDLLENLSGSAAIVLPDFTAVDLESESAPAIYALLMSVRDESVFSPRLARYLTLDDEDMEDAEESERTFRGVTLHLFTVDGEEPESGWAVVEGTAVVAAPVPYLEELVASLLGDAPPASLARLAEFRSMKENADRIDAYMYVNLTTLAAILSEEMARESEEEAPGDQPFDPGAVFQALRLDVFQSMYVTFWQGDDESRMDTGLTYREDEGLVKLLAYEPGPCPRPEFIPENAIGVTLTRFSLPRFWAGILEIMDAVSPGLSVMVTSQFQQLVMPYGFDFQEDVIGGLGDEEWVVYFPPPDGEPAANQLDWDQVMGVEISNREAMDTVVAGLLEAFGGGLVPREREVEGVIVRTIEHALHEEHDPMSVSYAFTDRYLLVGSGSPEVMDVMIRAMADPGRSLWERRDLSHLFASLPEEASAISYSDLGAMIEIGLGAVLSEMQEDEDPQLDLDPDAMRELGRHFGPSVSWFIKAPDGMHAAVRMTHETPSRRR